jgi:hypothetical protein
MSKNASCELRGEHPTRFCTCGGRITVLCDRCVPTHEATLNVKSTATSNCTIWT